MMSLGVLASAGVAAAPTVLSSTPANGATSVLVGANLNVYFSEEVTGYDGNVTITKVSDSTVIPYTRAFYTANNRLLLNPYGGAATVLEAGTQYRVDLTGGPTAIRSLSGTPMVSTSFTFTTKP